MSPLMENTNEQETSFPRVSGDEPQRFGRRSALLRFSPRERG